MVCILFFFNIYKLLIKQNTDSNIEELAILGEELKAFEPLLKTKNEIMVKSVEIVKCLSSYGK